MAGSSRWTWVFTICSRYRRLLSVALLAAALWCISAAPSLAAGDGEGATESNLLGFLGSELKEYSGSLGPFKNGEWLGSEQGCWACDNGGPATAAAALYVLDGSSRPDLLSDAEQTIDRAIATRQNPDGSFTGPPGDTQSAGVATMFFGVEFGTVYRLLGHDLSPARRLRWQRSLAAAADFLGTDGDTNWYANGNINLGYTEFLYLVWQATGEQKYERAYEASWRFTMQPPQSRFPGSGLVIVKPSTRPDGSDGVGYLTESGPGGTGFDAEYSSLQLDVASRLYLFSHDVRALRLANMLMNALMPRIDTTTWMLTTSGGTRHTTAGRQVGFMASAFAVLGLDGNRPDLKQYILPQVKKEEGWYPQPFQADSGVFRRAFGGDLTTIALAASGLPWTSQGTIASSLRRAHGASRSVRRRARRVCRHERARASCLRRKAA